MNKMTKKISSVVAGLAITAAAALPLVDANATFQGLPGSDRQTFTLESPAPYVTFNSMTNNHFYPFANGDERNFVSLAHAGGQPTDDLTVSDGDRAYVFAYVHNNADETRADLVAENVTTRFNIDQNAQRNSSGQYISTATGNISWNRHVSMPANAPTSIYDTANFVANMPFSVNYVEGSARFINGPSGADGWEIGNPTAGDVTLGYESLDGRIPGCLAYVGWVRFAVNIEFEEPDFEFDKTVRMLGSGTGIDSWHKQISAVTDDIVEFRLRYANNSSRVHNGVMVVDELPAGLEYIVGSTVIYNGHNQDGLVVNDTAEENITTAQLYIGSGYADGSPAYVIFQARVTDASLLEACGLNSLPNVGRVYTTDGELESVASVVVNRDCEDIPERPELPRTGGSIAGILGFGSSLTAVMYYVLNRKKF